MDENGIPNFEYSKEDFVHSTPTWDSFTKTQLTEFDNLLGERWEKAMAQGYFNYQLTEADKKERVVPGRERYILALNLARGENRRMPEYIDSVNKPFDPKKFHFNKVKPGEIIMNFCPREEQQNGDLPLQNGTNQTDETRGSHKIIINVSPFEYGHVLLVPDIELNIPQKITQRGMKLTIEMILLSGHPGFCIGFNGLCALASVNHQHVHGWYVQHSLRTVEAPVKHIAGLCHEMVDMPTRGFIFQLHGSTVDELARAVYTVTNYFQENDIAHNLFVCRGVVFGEPADSSKTTVRINIWPRKKYIGDKSVTSPKAALTGVFNVAVAELAGHVPMYYPDRFHDLTEDEIISRLKDSMLTDERINEIRDMIKSLMEESSINEKS